MRSKLLYEHGYQISAPKENPYSYKHGSTENPPPKLGKKNVSSFDICSRLVLANNTYIPYGSCEIPKDIINENDDWFTRSIIAMSKDANLILIMHKTEVFSPLKYLT